MLRDLAGARNRYKIAAPTLRPRNNPARPAEGYLRSGMEQKPVQIWQLSSPMNPFIARDTSQYFPGIGPHTSAPLPKLNWAQRQARRVSDAVGGFWDRLVFVVKGGDIYDRD